MNTPTYRSIAGIKVKDFSPYLAILAVCLLTGCATPYQPVSAMGGYTDQMIGENTFSVSYSGNGYTKRETTYACFLRRCAEVTVTNQGDYFVIQDYEDFQVLLNQRGGNSIQGKIVVSKGVVPSSNPAAFDAQKLLDKSHPTSSKGNE